jgi:hypothetical protein
LESEPDLHKDPEAAAEMAVRAVLAYLTQSGIEDPAERRRWVEDVCRRISSTLSH